MDKGPGDKRIELANNKIELQDIKDQISKTEVLIKCNQELLKALDFLLEDFHQYDAAEYPVVGDISI